MTDFQNFQQMIQSLRLRRVSGKPGPGEYSISRRDSRLTTITIGSGSAINGNTANFHFGPGGRAVEHSIERN